MRAQIARKALEPPGMAEEDREDEAQPAQRPLSAGVLRHWGVVRCGCVEGVLATAILAGQHADVWDAASMLLRDHCRRVLGLLAPPRHLCPSRACRLSLPGLRCPGNLHRELPQGRQQALQRTLEAAANQMSPAEKRRSGPGPPPLLSLVRPLPGRDALQPRRVVMLSLSERQQGLAEGALSSSGSINPFIYNPYKVSRAGACSSVLGASCSMQTAWIPSGTFGAAAGEGKGCA